MTLVAVAIRLPEAFLEANRSARDNAALDWVDRQLGGGNSVLPAQDIAVQALGRIPRDGTFAVAVGTPRKDWSELAIPPTLENFMRYFLLPRRLSPDAPWILCFACDRSAFPDARPVWDDAANGLAILRRPA